jgi:hypothetical protein
MLSSYNYFFLPTDFDSIPFLGPVLKDSGAPRRCLLGIDFFISSSLPDISANFIEALALLFYPLYFYFLSLGVGVAALTLISISF